MTCGTVTIGDCEVSRLGFGTMRLVGDGVFGPPRDLAAARETLRLLPELGVQLVDTANAYGPLIAAVAMSLSSVTVIARSSLLAGLKLDQ